MRVGFQFQRIVAVPGKQQKHATFLRHWLMLRLLPRYPRKIDTAALQQRLHTEGFSASQRTIQRDLMSLSECFPLTWDDRNKPYGWSWARDAEVLDIPGIDPKTALAFRLAEFHLSSLLPISTLKDLGPHFKRAAEVLKQTRSGGLGLWPNKVRILPRNLSLTPAKVRPAVQEGVYQALLENRRMEVTYQPREAKSPVQYEVNPLGLVFRHGVIYLVCTLWNYEDIKQLVLHRIHKVRVLEEKARRPTGFSLDSYIASGAFGYPVSDKQIRLRVLFDAEVAKHLYETPLVADQMLREQSDGRVLLSATVQDTAELRWWLLGFGDGIEVLAPAGLRAEFASMAQALWEQYKA